ncbi:hypothetical protein E4K72_14165 [Oxalobacteraceae bacterium OM1]|nr:hypothetical protein E4K72_14165 [Oxalobacteraceae bacterium OM1]
MDPVSIALAFFLKNPSLTVSTVDKAMAPRAIDMTKMQESLADLSKEVLLCYHKTARFHAVDVLAVPWTRESQYGAEKSIVLRIHYAGIGAVNRYEMTVAVMGKQDKVRATVVSDSAVIPYNKKCALEDWTGA